MRDVAEFTIQQAFNAAVQYHNAGRLLEAEQLYRKILAQHPANAEALHLLGVLSAQLGRHVAAVELIQQALAIKPDWPMAYNNLGSALQATGQLDQAIAAHRRAIDLSCDYADAYGNLGATLHDKGQLGDAIAALRQAISLNPKNPVFHSNLASVLNDSEQFDAALAAARAALALSPRYAEAENNLGNAHRGRGELDESIAALNRALALKPDFADAHYNLGIVLQEKGLVDEAVAMYRKAMALKPGDGKTRNNLALALLLLGDWQQGWVEYEWRWSCKELISSRRDFAQPQWDGRPLQGQTILLYAEQGFGDTLQFVRYLPLVIERGGSVVFECQPELCRLARAMNIGVLVVPKGQLLPKFDVHLPLMSLPRVMNTTPASIPRDVPYLHADATEVEIWRKRMMDGSSSIKVGLAWAGSGLHKNDRNRSIKLSTLASLAGVPNVRFFSLQKGQAASETRSSPMHLTDMTEDFHDFAAAAAFIANLDLVIAVDTSIVHLAGAMGKAVWTLLPFSPDWRWLLKRGDSLWYPTMRLFRQPSPGDWSSVIAAVAEALTLWQRSPQRTDALCYGV
jgi:tetratricopeptide (TPR) repeat protein